MPASSEQPCACGRRDCKHRFDWPSGTPPGPAARSATPPRKQPQSQAAARVVGGSRAAGRMASSASGRRTAGSPVRGSRSARGGATQSQGARGGAAGSAKKRSATPPRTPRQVAREKEEQEKKEREAKSRSLFRNLVYVKGPEEASDETSMAAVERLVASGEITAATLVWSEGMEAWYAKAPFWHSRHSAKFCLLCTGRRWVTARIASPGRLGRRLRGFEEAIGESCVKCTSC